ncbi:hypothetical protein AOQ73_18140 [Bradyrhizobium pachyrhizi]|nr:hypothetical protein AOQ73_18140 [Bradyrhizobium pachyrhizi]
MIVKGPVLHLKESRNERGQVIGHSVQMMKKGLKGYDLLNIKLPEGIKPENYKEGTIVELAVDYSVFEGSVFFRATRDLRDFLSADRPPLNDKPAPTAAALKPV